jgi:hypothetical protein
MVFSLTDENGEEIFLGDTFTYWDSAGNEHKDIVLTEDIDIIPLVLDAYLVLKVSSRKNHLIDYLKLGDRVFNTYFKDYEEVVELNPNLLMSIKTTGGHYTSDGKEDIRHSKPTIIIK